MKTLITGVTGFVGQKLAGHLVDTGAHVVGLARKWSDSKASRLPQVEQREGDLTDSRHLKELLEDASFDTVFHLAGQSSVYLSWSDPVSTYQANTITTVSLVELLKTRTPPPPKLLFVSTGEVYGPLNRTEICNEDHSLASINPYGTSKVFAEKICQEYYSQWVIARPFSHFGVGQAESFCIPNFCKQIALMKRGLKPPVLHVGNIKSVRNFTPVEDVIQAYLVLMSKAEPGGIYNVASDNYLSIEDVLNLLKEISRLDFEIKTDSLRLRPVDLSCGAKINTQKLRDLGWEPKGSIKETLRKMLDFYFNES